MKNNKLYIILLLFISFLGMDNAWGQPIWQNSITGTNPNTSNPYTTGQTHNANITVSGIGRGSGANGTNASDRYNANGWNTTSIDLTAYFYFTLIPNTGYQINFTSFVYIGQASPQGPTQFAFRSSADNYGSNIGTATADGATIVLTTSEFQNITEPITFRIYAWGTTNPGGTFSINDFVFNGSVSLSCVKPATPSGSITVTEPICGEKLFTYEQTPPEGIKYFWQTTAGGTSVLDEVTALNNTKTVATNNTSWYIRAQRIEGECWSEEAIAANSGILKTTPIFMVNPSGVTVEEESPEAQNITFSAVVNAQEGTVYRWQENTESGWVDIPDAAQNYSGMATTTLTISEVSHTMSGNLYRLHAINNPCEAFSGEAELIVKRIPPTVQNIEVMYSAVSCGDAQLSVTAINSEENTIGLTYSWYKFDSNSDTDWVELTDVAPYSGTTTDILSISSTSGLNGVQYHAKVHHGNVSCYGASRTIRLEDEVTIWNGTAWSNNFPDITKKAVIDGVYNTDINGGFEACACEVTSSGNLTIEEGEDVIIHNGLSNSGTVLVKNNANLIQINDLAVNSGDIIVERITRPMNTYSFTYWGSPVETDLSDINWHSESAPGVFDVPENTNVTTSFAWNASANSWYFTPYTGTMNTAYGYIIKAPNSFTVVGGKKPVKATFNGVPNNGNSTVDIVPNNDNLLSNPYPSAIDIDKFLTEYGETAVIPTIYLWTHASTPTPTENGSFDYADSDFATYTMLGGTASINYPEELKPAGKVASGQGFFIKGTTNGGTVEFKNSYRYDANTEGYNNSLFFKTLNPVAENQETPLEKHRFWLNITGDNAAFKQILLGYSDQASDGIDYLDGLYYSGANPVSFYSWLSNEPYTIQAFALPFEVTDIIPLGYTIAEAGNYTIALDDFDGLFENQDIFIKDNLLETIHNLKEEPYVFISSSGTFHDRFEVVFQSDGSLSINNPYLNDNWVVYTKGNQFHLESLGFEMKDIYVYDMLGREVYRDEGINTNRYQLDKLKANQMLIFRMIATDNRVFVRKTAN